MKLLERPARKATIAVAGSSAAQRWNVEALRGAMSTFIARVAQEEGGGWHAGLRSQPPLSRLWVS